MFTSKKLEKALSILEMKDHQKRHILVLNFAVSTWQISWSLTDCLVTKRLHWNEDCLCYHIFSVSWSAPDSTYIEPSQPNTASKYSPSLTLNILHLENCSISFYDVQEGKLWLCQWSKIMEPLNHWVRRSGGGRPWIKSCCSHTKDGIDVWYQLSVAYKKISSTGFPFVF